MAFAVVKQHQEAGTNRRNQRADVCWSGVTSGTKRNVPHLKFAQPDAPAICSGVVTETVTQGRQGGFEGGHFRRICQPGGQIEHGSGDQSRYGGAADVFHLAARKERKPEPRRFLPEGFCPARVVFAQPQFAASRPQPRFVLITGPDSFKRL